jgi:cytochrome c oxidase cbb3-type subunit II
MSERFITFPVALASVCLSAGFGVLGLKSQLSSLEPSYKYEDGSVSDIYPVRNEGVSRQGRDIFVREGCATCHTQFIRGESHYEIERGWAKRRGVARDFLFESNASLGLTRLGPDLANYGNSDWGKTPKALPVASNRLDESRLLEYLFNPQKFAKHTIMPSYRNLFEKAHPRDTVLGAVVLTDTKGEKFVPTPDALSLVAYLKSLDRSTPLPEKAVVGVSPTKNK